MLDTFKIYDELKEQFGEQAASKLTAVLGQIYQDLSDAVTKKEFNELKDVVAELVQAQKRTEQRLNELAEAQKRTEQRVEELAQAQKRTEEQIQKLTRRVSNIEDQLGGISNTIGYSLEDRSFAPLKQLLEKEFNIRVTRLIRKNLVYPDGKFDEINIYGEGGQDGKEIVVIGESKAQFGLKDVKQFLRLLERVKKYLNKEIFPLALAYQYHPRAESELKKHHIKYYWSYELS